MYLMLSTVMSTMYWADPGPLQGSAQAASAVSSAGFGLSLVTDGVRLPPVRSVQWMVWVTDAVVSGMILLAWAQLPSYSVAVGAQVPQVMRPSAVWALSTSCAESTTVMV